MATVTAASGPNHSSSVDAICAKLRTTPEPKPEEDDNADNIADNATANDGTSGKVDNCNNCAENPAVAFLSESPSADVATTRHHRRKNFAPKCIVVQRAADDDDDDDQTQDGGWSREPKNDDVLDLRVTGVTSSAAATAAQIEENDASPMSEPEAMVGERDGDDNAVLDLSTTPRNSVERGTGDVISGGSNASESGVFKSVIRNFLLQQERLQRST